VSPKPQRSTVMLDCHRQATSLRRLSVTETRMTPTQTPAPASRATSSLIHSNRPTVQPGGPASPASPVANPKRLDRPNWKKLTSNGKRIPLFKVGKQLTHAGHILPVGSDFDSTGVLPSRLRLLYEQRWLIPVDDPTVKQTSEPVSDADSERRRLRLLNFPRLVRNALLSSPPAEQMSTDSEASKGQVQPKGYQPKRKR
jgi:hypothetical protein